MNLLFCVDDKFSHRMLVTLYSIIKNTRERNISFYLASKDGLKNEEEIKVFCQTFNVNYQPIKVGGIFENAPSYGRYPETVYYRLLAHEYLPKDLDKILYLDADILVINDILKLYQKDIEDYLCAACSHTSAFDSVDAVNRWRVDALDNEAYFNSGVLLMNLKNMRKEINQEDIYNYIDQTINLLKIVLPDQDVLNTLYGTRIRALPDIYFNYDTRFDFSYFRDDPSWNPDKVMEQTIILHFCGSNKPWDKHARNPYAYLYKHYERKMIQELEEKGLEEE